MARDAPIRQWFRWLLARCQLLQDPDLATEASVAVGIDETRNSGVSSLLDFNGHDRHANEFFDQW